MKCPKNVKPLLMVLAVFLVFEVVGCAADNLGDESDLQGKNTKTGEETMALEEENEEEYEDPEKQYWIDNRDVDRWYQRGYQTFSYENFVVILSREATFSFKIYTPEDFPEIRCSAVYHLNTLRADHPDPKAFRSLLSIYLEEPGEENVVKAIRLIEKRRDVIYAGPVAYLFPCASL